MSRSQMPSSLQGRNTVSALKHKIEIHLGDCIQLEGDEATFQVLGIDIKHKKCWIREWPLLTDGSPVFEVSTNQINSNNN